jgi:hypothetical protein
MKRHYLPMWLALFAIGSFAQRPFVRAHLEPANEVTVGQPVHLAVTVLVPNFFTGAVDLPEFELENAIVILPQDRPQHSNEQVGGVTYAGITQTYTIYPQQPGKFRLPAAQITVPYAENPPKTTIVHLSLPGLAFDADVPPAARGLDYFLPTTSLTMQQRWSPPLKALRAGDTIERTIIVTATMTQAMLIPPLPFTAPDGIRIYPQQPDVHDQKTDRGEFVFGRRTQSAKYLIEKPGDYTLPAIELKWWNLATRRMVTATVPAVHFTAAPNPGYAPELPPETELGATPAPVHASFWSRYRVWFRLVAPSVIALLALAWLCWRYLPPTFGELKRWYRARQHSEPAYFRRLQHACSRHHAMQAYTALLSWLQVSHPGISLEGFLRQAGDSQLCSEVNRLGEVLFGRQMGHEWSGSSLVKALRGHRRGLRLRANTQALPPLNPTG